MPDDGPKPVGKVVGLPPTLTLQLEAEPEEAIEGWHLADGHWDNEGGIGIVLIVSPAMRERIMAGPGPAELGKWFAITEHCMKVVLDRQLRAAIRKVGTSA